MHRLKICSVVLLFALKPACSSATIFSACGFNLFSTIPHDTIHLIQRPCYQQGSPFQDPAGNWTTRRPHDNRKETQTTLERSCIPFNRFGKNHLASTVTGGRRQGGQRKRWKDIREWTGLEFAKSQSLVEDREKWRKLVAKSPVVPQ